MAVKGVEITTPVLPVISSLTFPADFCYIISTLSFLHFYNVLNFCIYKQFFNNNTHSYMGLLHTARVFCCCIVLFCSICVHLLLEVSALVQSFSLLMFPAGQLFWVSFSVCVCGGGRLFCFCYFGYFIMVLTVINSMSLKTLGRVLCTE